MNLFFKKLIGQLQSSEKLEAHILQVKNDITRYRKIETSQELKEYRELKEVIEAPEFKEKKRTLTQTKYKDTDPYHTLQDLHRMEKNKELQLYFYVNESKVLAEYLSFRQSENYVKLSDKASVSHSPDLRRMQKFEHSRAYKTWLKYSTSELPQQFKALQEQTESETFKKEKRFWENPRRWLTTPEYKQECRFAELSALDDIRFFLAQDEKQIRKIESYKTTFSDDFNWKKMQDSAWQPGFAYKSDKLKQQHSFTAEHQANNGGHNTGTINGFLTILTHKETIVAPAWDDKKGFVNQNFGYTSDVIQTANAFEQEEGIFMAKIRCTGRVHHTFTLGCRAKTPLIHLFNYNGKKLYVGCTSDAGFEGTTVSGLSWADYHIFTLRWTKTEMIWYINNIEVFRTTKHIPSQALYLSVASFLPKTERPAEGRMDIDWVRVYKQA